LSAFKKARHVVRGHDIAPPTRSGQAGISISGRDIQNLLSWPYIECFAEFLTDNLQCRTNDGVIS
jgi:hypothetical protein